MAWAQRVGLCVCSLLRIFQLVETSELVEEERGVMDMVQTKDAVGL